MCVNLLMQDFLVILELLVEMALQDRTVYPAIQP